MTRRPRVLLIGAEDEENLAVRTLAAVLRQQGIDARVAGFSRDGHLPGLLRSVARSRPDVIAISLAFQSLAARYFHLVERIRAQGYRGHIIVGGHFPTFEYRTILETQPGIDSVGRFEGEHSLPPLVTAIHQGLPLDSVPNLAYRTASGVQENPVIHAFPSLDRMPVRASRPQVRLGERFATLITSRGCSHSACLYCCIGAFHREKRCRFALRDAADVAREIAVLQQSHGIRIVQFHDDNFVLASRQATFTRLHQLQQALADAGVCRERLAFLIKARPDAIDDDVARALAELGCVGAFLGIENASQSGLQALMRGARTSDLARAFEALERQRIAVTYNLLIFHPHATMAEVRDNIAFVRSRPACPFDFGRAEIVAGSPLERLVIEEGRRRGQWPHWGYVMDDPIVQRLFRINVRTFRARGSAYPSLMHALIALSYHAHLLTRLYPGMGSDAFFEDTAALITRANGFVLDCLDSACELATCDTDDCRVDTLRATLEAGCRQSLAHAHDLTNRMHRLQAAERIFARFALPGEVQRRPSLLRLFQCASPFSRTEVAPCD